MAEDQDEKDKLGTKLTSKIFEEAAERGFGERPFTQEPQEPVFKEQQVLKNYYDGVIDFFDSRKKEIEKGKFGLNFARLSDEDFLELATNYTGALVTQDYSFLMDSQDEGFGTGMLSKGEKRKGFKALEGYFGRAGIQRMRILGEEKAISLKDLKNLNTVINLVKSSEQIKVLKDTHPERQKMIDSWLKNLENVIGPKKPGLLGRLRGSGQ